MENPTRKPVAVLISDIHFNLQTIELAAAAFNQAAELAIEYQVPLVVAGDTHDTKANLRGECVNAMISCYGNVRKSQKAAHIFTLIGNHDKINEKSDSHALHFLAPYTELISVHYITPRIKVNDKFVNFIPYQHNPDSFRKCLKTIEKGSTIICHQGIEGSNSGDYIQDKSAIHKEDVKDFRVISGHYHQRQDIITGPLRNGYVGLWSYIGNPYTLNYAEANDPSKGFQVLYSDGTLEHIPTNLREHVVIELTAYDAKLFSLVQISEPQRPEDLIWVKIRATKEILSLATKSKIANSLKIPGDFRLDLIPLDTLSTYRNNTSIEIKQPDLLDSIIDSISNTTDEQKARLKQLWKDLK